MYASHSVEMTEIFSRILEKHTLRKSELVQNKQVKRFSIQTIELQIQKYVQNLLLQLKKVFAMMKLLPSLNWMTRYSKEAKR